MLLKAAFSCSISRIIARRAQEDSLHSRVSEPPSPPAPLTFHPSAPCALAISIIRAALPPLGLLFAVVLFPITQGLVELAFYFLYVMPRLAKQINPWAAYALASLFLGIQHAMIPLRFDPAFFTWRLLMFIPFAFLVGAVLKWRPRLLIYLAVVHVLMDFSTATMYLTGF